MTRVIRSTRYCSYIAAVALAVTAAPASSQTLLQPGHPVTESRAPVPGAVWVSPSFAGLFENTFGDFRRLPSKGTATILAIGAAAAIAGHNADRSVTTTFSGSRRLGGAL